MKRIIILLVLAVGLTFSSNAFAVSTMVGTNFGGWTSGTVLEDASNVGLTLEGDWYINKIGLLGINTPYGDTPKMTFNSGANFVMALYKNYDTGSIWRVELDDVFSEGQFHVEGASIIENDSNVASNYVDIALSSDEGPVSFSVAGLTINAISFLGLSLDDTSYDMTSLKQIAYAPTPIPASALLLLSSLVGMVGIRRFVS